MPTAQCRCQACGHTFVHLTFKGDDTPAVCPKCKSREIESKADQEGFMAGPGLGSRIAGAPKGPS
ncbi:zinc ribbon domain-containing protein [uncultured Desulfosarcina sp.]|uniref:zinc ribbon domain-containing protein n=1 Tax=uncultured Desulfosarcina sp. TaxID=218289 RepID=UPI0029C8D277|nr:zinc ribbon domain-containing protein [uncultured Desulfosarcina sp.]